MFDGTAESSKNNNPFAKYSGYMLLIIIICVPWIITLQSENSDLKDDLETANKEIAEMEDEVFTLQENDSAWYVQLDELEAEYEDLKSQYDDAVYELADMYGWLYEVAICTPGDSIYHHYDCDRWRGTNYNIYSVDDAIARGYEPCSYCQ